ncbi:MAG TPA: hypothetical protein VFG52_05260, partial [Xanthomonadales bacterium]|nr:hypothetical protein [Xanthomonadales bacterium]
MNTATRPIEATDESVSTTRKVAAVAHDAIDGAASKAEPVERHIREQAGKAGEQLEVTQAAATEQVEQVMNSMARFIRE